MTRVYVFCEGQTEETFVNEVLGRHFNRLNTWLIPIVVHTSKQGRGGVSTYGKIKSQIERQCKQDKTAWVTTLLDFYGLPQDFPGLNLHQSKPTYDQAQLSQQAFQDDINQTNFIAHLVVHEFEALLFSAPHLFEIYFDQSRVVSQLKVIRNKYPTPEHINDGREMAPSKRILNVCANYDKILHGSLLALDMGLELIRQECVLFNKWVERIESLTFNP